MEACLPFHMLHQDESSHRGPELQQSNRRPPDLLSPQWYVLHAWQRLKPASCLLESKSFREVTVS